MQKKIISIFRKFSAKWRSTPNFIIAGTQKGGTTSMYDYLVQHPQILPATTKEVHFFENPNNRKKGILWYKSHFPLKLILKKKKAITGEATPHMYSYHVPRLMHKMNPDLKVIFILRDPISRAFSHYQHNRRRKGRENLSFSEAIRQEKSRISNDIKKVIKDEWHNDAINRTFSYMSRGEYEEQLDRWKKYFNKENILILKSEDFFESPQKTLNEVTKFLNIDKHGFKTSKRSNVGNYSDKIDLDDLKYLENFYRQ